MITHLNNIASVGPLLVDEMKRRGIQARMIGRHASTESHLERFREYRRVARSTDTIHLHFALYGAYLLGARPPDIVHCHGTDVRPNLSRPILRRLTLPGLRNARLVLFSTPDLEDPLRSEGLDARYLPNPIDIADPDGQGVGEGVLIFSRLDRFKGGHVLLETASILTREGVSVTAVAWGELSDDARSIPGLRVVPFMSHEESLQMLRRHAIVLGQIGAGFLSVSELEAMAAGKPVVMRYRDWELIPDRPPVTGVGSADEAAAAVLQLLEDESRLRERGASARRWVMEHHGVMSVVDRLLGLYDSVGINPT